MINYTIKLITWKHNPDQFGFLPIYIQISVNRKTRYISTGHYVAPKMWDPKAEQIKKGFPDAETTNPEIAQRKTNVLRYVAKLQVDGKEFTAESIKSHFTGKDLTNIFNFIDNFCIEVKHKKSDDTIENYQKHRRKLLEFHGSDNLNFEDISHDFLARYERHLRDGSEDRKEAGNNYVHAIWKTLKTFFNAAKRKKLIDVYPFDQYENPVYVDPEKDYLNLEELKKLEEFADSEHNEVLKQTAVYFLLGCYSGLRISDWKAFDIKTHVVGDMIKLRAKKNNEWIVIPFSGPWSRNIERMRLTPLAIEEPTLNEKIKVIARKLNIKKKLSSHCARKTFAVTLCADQGISLEVCATLMGITVDVCFKNYYRVTDYKIKAEVLKAWKDL